MIFYLVLLRVVVLLSRLDEIITLENTSSVSNFSQTISTLYYSIVSYQIYICLVYNLFTIRENHLQCINKV